MFENKTYQPLQTITFQIRKTKRGAKVCSRARTRPSKEFPAENFVSPALPLTLPYLS